MGTLLTRVSLLAHQDTPHPLVLSSFPLVGPKTFTSPQSDFSLGDECVFPFAELYFSNLLRSHLTAAQLLLISHTPTC